MLRISNFKFSYCKFYTSIFFLGYTKNNISLFQKKYFSLTILGDILTLVLITIILLPSNERLLRRIKIKR